jgi:hypothetical protein
LHFPERPGGHIHKIQSKGQFKKNLSHLRFVPVQCVSSTSTSSFRNLRTATRTRGLRSRIVLTPLLERGSFYIDSDGTGTLHNVRRASRPNARGLFRRPSRSGEQRRRQEIIYSQQTSTIILVKCLVPVSIVKAQIICVGILLLTNVFIAPNLPFRSYSPAPTLLKKTQNCRVKKLGCYPIIL